ncbi:MAG: efflux RND transporter periplasmic adaptor subunit [Pseudomonadota bacterium]
MTRTIDRRRAPVFAARPARLLGGGLAGLLSALALLVAPAASRAEGDAALPPVWFEGAVQPRERVEISTRVNGVVVEVLISGGERVARGDPLFRIDPAEFEIAVAGAAAALAAARAERDLAADEAARQGALLRRGAGAEARAVRARLELEVAEAAVARQEADLRAAELDLARTAIRSPIAGVASRPNVSVGAFVEAEAGAPLGEIVSLDPVLVAYRVPVERRLATLQAARVSDAVAMFERLELTLELPSGDVYPQTGRPLFESVSADAETGALTTWGEFSNPDRVLTPGMTVRVQSVLQPETR